MSRSKRFIVLFVRGSAVCCEVPSERLFSRVGDILTKRRNRLRTELLDMLCTLSINQDYFPEYISEVMVDLVQEAMSPAQSAAPSDAGQLAWWDAEE